MNLCGAGYELLTDLYQITMAQGYWEAGKADDEACFHMYFRDYPFKGGYAVACGMAQLAETGGAALLQNVAHAGAHLQLL